MLAILGASGQVGGAIASSLAGDPGAGRVRMIGRRAPAPSPDAAEWVAADLRDGPAALAGALGGASAVFVLNPVPPDADDVRAEGAALARVIAEAVVAAGRPRVVALSGQGAHLGRGNAIVQALHALEAALAATGARTTFVRATSFMQNRVPFALAAATTGTWHALQAPDLPLPAVSAVDVGRCAARMLRDPEPPGIVNVTGAGTWSERDVARMVERIAGRPVTVEEVPPAHRAAALQAAGLGRSYAEAVAAMQSELEAGALPFAPADLEVAGEETLEAVLRRALAA